VGDDRPLPERWARAPITSWLPPSLRRDRYPGDPSVREAAEALRAEARARGVAAPPVLIDRRTLIVNPGATPILDVHRLGTRPWPAATGCVDDRIGAEDAIYVQRCRAWAIPVDDTVDVAFQTTWKTARGEIVVRTPHDQAPTVESHGGAPGASLIVSPAGRFHRFRLDGIEPAVEGRRRPRVRVRLTGTRGPVERPTSGMIDRLVAIAWPGSPPPVPGDTRRTVARLRAGGVEAEQAWVAVDGRPIALVARVTDAGWRWFDEAGAAWRADAPIIASTREGWAGQTPSAITRAAATDLPSSDAADEPQSGRR